MDDLIYKQTALDAIDSWRKDYPLDMQEPIDDCWNAVKELPTVQPEIIRCKDCKFSHMTNDGRYCKYCDQFTDDYGELVEMYFDSDFYCGYAERRTE